MALSKRIPVWTPCRYRGINVRGHYNYTHRQACAIQMTDTVIITGGWHSSSRSRVQEYNLQGSVARLPDLNTGRFNHACGHYVHQGQIVSTEEDGSSIHNTIKHLHYTSSKVLLLQHSDLSLSAGLHCQWRSPL